MTLAGTYSRLDSLLEMHGALWRAQPFKEPAPSWCDTWPALAAHVRALPDGVVEGLAGDNRGLAEFIGAFVPELAELPRLIDLPKLSSPGLPPRAPGHAHHLKWEIPGRKAAQIQAFASQVGRAEGPFLEWCGGKGHLGRLLGAAWQVPVTTLELDGMLCAEGESLARRAGVAQDFRVGDALAPPALADVAGSHALALHACGDLHLRLVRHAAAAGFAALDVAPCCYHRTTAELAPALGGGSLQLDRDGLRLAARDTVVASPRELGRSKREQAWKLGFVAWRREVMGEGAYQTFKPVPDAWLKGDFGAFCRLLCEREKLSMPPPGDLAGLEALGWRRAAEVSRLTLVRLAFRRPLEVWLALDRARCLEQQGYTVRLGEFCPRQVTPRNILISARR